MRGSFFSNAVIPSNISTYLSRTLIIITVAATFLIGGVLIFQQTLYFDRISKQKSDEYIENQKIYIQEIVKNEILYIEIQNESFKRRINDKIRQNVEQAMHTAESIYDTYTGKKSEQEIKSLIIATIASLKFETEYENVFIGGLDGTGIFYPGRPEFTGKNMLQFVDANGSSVVLRELKLLKSENEGFLDYTVKAEDSSEIASNQKVCFVKKFGHFNWYFGSKQYVNDYFPKFKEEIAQKISAVRFKHGGYVFMNAMNGTPIVMDGKVYSGKINLLKDTLDPRHPVFLQELDLIKKNPDGGYFYYQWNKIGQTSLSEKCSYVQPFLPYNWIIGAGFYLDEMEQSIIAQQKALNADQQKNIILILIIFLFLLILEAFIIFHFNKRYKSDFERFFNFFFISHNNLNKLDVSKFYFEEFKQAGIAANKMIEQRVEVENRLIEEQKKATESDRLKSAFLANMSHEIRTPMNAIIGFSELLEDDTQDSQDKSLFINLIKRNGETLLHLINDIIDISKIEANLLAIKKRPVDMNVFLDEIDRHYQGLIASKKDKNIQFELKRNVSPEKIINTDAARLRQIFNNLIGNAIKFTASGTIEVNVQMEGEFVYFSVSDTGIGIPVNQQDTIFERFIQADQGNKSYYGGNGLGLAISKNLIELLGGSIGVVSEPGKGSTFTFHISTN
jgi:signal transduction histidine kinase